MFGIPFLTTAWWAAKALFVKDTASRFLNKEAIAALAIAACFLVAVAGLFALYKAGGSSAVAGWQSKLMQSRYVAVLKERKARRDADARAAAERQVLVEQIRETAKHAATLEQEIARLTENPVCFPAAITKELRK